MQEYARVLTIAGSDSGGGAGIQADLKTISACGGYGLSAITAITAQNTMGVRDILELPDSIIENQIRAVLEDIRIDAVKIGMLGSARIAHLVASLIREYGLRNVVLDPVLVATSGDQLSADDTIQVIKQELIPLSSIITPNIIEAEILSGISIKSPKNYESAWLVLKDLGAEALLLKGGHGSEDILYDTLFQITDAKTQQYSVSDFTNPRIYTRNTHGTGCTLSSAIATFLAQGMDKESACKHAIAYLHQAIVSGASMSIGNGSGPVDHMWGYDSSAVLQNSK